MCPKIIKAFYLVDIYVKYEDEIEVSSEEHMDISLAM